MTTDTANQANEMYQVIGRTLREYQAKNQGNFTGIAHVSISDLQAICDEAERREAKKYQRPLRRTKVHHGYQARVFGIRVVAHKGIDLGKVELQ